MNRGLYWCASTNSKEMPNGSLRSESSERLFENNHKIVCKNGFYLKDNISNAQYETWFDSKCINVFNKAHCGNGGTTGFINYALKHNRGLLIIVPNVSICKSKEEEYKDNANVCCVYGGSGKIVKDVKVVIATYDQFHRMMNGGVEDCGIDFKEDWTSSIWSGRTILIDEYHKVVDECSFRGVCFDVTKLIKEQNNGVILMSATPHWGYIDFLKEYIPKKDIKTYTVEYEDEVGLLVDKGTPRLIQIYDVKKKIADIISKMYRSPKNKQIVVFFNNRDGIKKLIRKMAIKDVEVLCSQEHSDDFGEYYSDVFDKDKSIHFMTSAYFAGCDINIHVDACVIIGSKCQSYLSYSSREIKQMIGRFRQGCSGVHLFYNGNVQDVYDYDENKTQYDMCMQYLEDVGEDWITDNKAVKLKQKSLMLKDNLECSECWSSIDSLKKMLTSAGYIVKKKEVGEFESIYAKRKMSSKETKQRIIEGGNVSWDENSMAGQYKAYLDKFGAEALMSASQMDVKNWYKIRKNVGEDEDRLSLMLPNELFEAVGLEEGYYSAAYLMDCMKYVGVKCKFGELSLKFSEIFGCYAILLSVGSKDHKREKYLIIKTNKGDFDGESLYNKSPSENPQLDNSLVSLNHKKTNDGHLLAKTFRLATITFQSLNGIKLYDWVMVDKEQRLPMVKGNDELLKEWNGIKNYRQSKISEMFRYTEDEYRHTIKEMEYINILICDIDDGLSFNEFKERYKEYRWTAYPTLNNIYDDWRKFRVIIPLARPLELKGDHNLKVLKLLRVMFCPLEDPNHQMASYINQGDWEHRYENDGDLWCIEQELVDNLTLRMQNFNEYKAKSFDNVGKIDTKTLCLPSLTIEEAKDYFEKSFGSVDGARHKALFIIKNRLSVSDRLLFENWLIMNHPTYIAKWKSHKVVWFH